MGSLNRASWAGCSTFPSRRHPETGAVSDPTSARAPVGVMCGLIPSLRVGNMSVGPSFWFCMRKTVC